MLRFRDWWRTAFSGLVATLLWALLRRCIRTYGVEPDALLLHFGRDFRAAEWLIVTATVVTAGVGFAKRDARLVAVAQAAGLAAGLFLVLYELGNAPGKKVDLRLGLALVGAAASLFGSYVCALTQVGIALRRLTRNR